MIWVLKKFKIMNFSFKKYKIINKIKNLMIFLKTKLLKRVKKNNFIEKKKNYFK